MECNHIVAYRGTQVVTADGYKAARKKMDEDIEFFNTTRKAVPHPGHLKICSFCTKCGKPNEMPRHP